MGTQLREILKDPKISLKRATGDSSNGNSYLEVDYVPLHHGACLNKRTKKMSNARPAKGPVFIVGMNGSGTTMILDHLNNHSELYGFRLETKILPYYLFSPGRYGGLHDDKNRLRLWREMSGAFPFKKVNRGVPIPMPENWQEIFQGPAEIFDYILKYFASLEGKSRWCEKTPMHVQHMVQLGKIFPDARFIHIIRDGRDCAASFHRRWQYTPRNTILRWKRVVSEGCGQGSQLGERYLEIFYEDITQDPEKWLRRICMFLSVPFEDAILRSARKRQRVKGVAAEHIVLNSKKYETYFNDRDLQELEIIAGKILNELGYQTRYPDSDVDPPWFLPRVWALIDYVRLGLAEINRKTQSGKRMSLSLMIGRIKVALQQKRTNKY